MVINARHSYHIAFADTRIMSDAFQGVDVFEHLNKLLVKHMRYVLKSRR